MVVCDTAMSECLTLQCRHDRPRLFQGAVARGVAKRGRELDDVLARSATSAAPYVQSNTPSSALTMSSSSAMSTVDRREFRTRPTGRPGEVHRVAVRIRPRDALRRVGRPCTAFASAMLRPP